MSYHVDHTGKENINSYGLKMKIIKYRSQNDIDVQFEDGTIVTATMYLFRNGWITNPNRTKQDIERHKYIGISKQMNCGMNATIIDYINKGNITVKFDDGTVISNRSYGNFKDGKINNPNIIHSRHNKSNTNIVVIPSKKDLENDLKELKVYSQISKKYGVCKGTVEKWCKSYNLSSKETSNEYLSQIQSKECREKYLNMTNYATNGQFMTVIDYIKNDNITVQFEDGTIVKNRRIRNFEEGVIANPNKKYSTSASINEYTMSFYLSKYGFSKAPSYSLEKYGFGRMELDSFNENFMIGVEYDGRVHRNHIDNDIKKDNACKKAGIELIRIRARLDSVSDYSLSYLLYDEKPFSKEYEKILQEICDYISIKIGLPKIKVDFEKDKDKIQSIYKNEIVIDHIGEVFYDKSGNRAQIIDYLPLQKARVRFDDGTEKEYFYNNLRQGKFHKDGKSRNRGQEVICVETMKKYSNMRKATEETGVSYKLIHKCCKNNQMINENKYSAKGYHWRYASDFNDQSEHLSLLNEIPLIKTDQSDISIYAGDLLDGEDQVSSVEYDPEFEQEL